MQAKEQETQVRRAGARGPGEAGLTLSHLPLHPV